MTYSEPSVLIIGGGFLGAALASELQSRSPDVVVGSRRPLPLARDWRHVDVSDSRSCRALLRDVEPDAVVLVHGPSDITWCEANAKEAMETHRSAMERVCQFAPDAWKLLISTDNVFPGDRPLYSESDPVEPANVYGRAKLAAERVLDDDGSGLVLRVSVVYGWERSRPGRKPNFFHAAYESLSSGRCFDAPVDHWNTPVLADDFVDVASSAIKQQPPGLVHVAGPDVLSRYEWAIAIADQLEAERSLVRPVSKDESSYACRPRYGALISQTLPNLVELQLVGAHEGIKRLLQDRDNPDAWPFHSGVAIPEPFPTLGT